MFVRQEPEHKMSISVGIVKLSKVQFVIHGQNFGIQNIKESVKYLELAC